MSMGPNDLTPGLAFGDHTAADLTPRGRILQILAAQALLSPGDLRLDARPEELGLDSLGLVEAIFAMEEAFDISIPFNAQEMGAEVPGASGFDTSTIGSLMAAIEALVVKA